MSNSRTPLAKALVSGAALKNPQRYRGHRVVSGVGPLGDPDPKMTPDQREAWEEFAAELPWLRRSHRAIVHLASIVQARLDHNPSAALLAVQGSILAKLGATPISNQSLASEDEADPSDEYFR